MSSTWDAVTGRAARRGAGVPAPRRLWERVLADPHAPLAAVAVVLVAGEWNRMDRTLEWPVLEALVAALGLSFAWRQRDGLKIVPLLALGAAFQIAWAVVHLHFGIHGDLDSGRVYRTAGQELLDGRYPSTAYPPGAVALFALETWLGRGASGTANALLMVPFQMLCVAGTWALRTRWSSWLAAFVALWPANLYHWEFRFDLVPAASIVAGIVLARGGRWRGAGLVLGAGALVKWTPGLTAVALGLWLLSSGRVRELRSHLLAFAAPFVLVSGAVLLWRPTEALAPYRYQSARFITGESLPYLMLHVVGLSEPRRYYWGPANVPPWANGAATALQGVAVLAVLGLAAVVRRQASALALAALAPAVFLLTNRIFSPQFFVVILVGCAIAGALVVGTGRELLALTAMLGGATVANATLFPALAHPVAQTPGWTYASATALVLGSAATAWLVVCARRAAAAG